MCKQNAKFLHSVNGYFLGQQKIAIYISRDYIMRQWISFIIMIPDTNTIVNNKVDDMFNCAHTVFVISEGFHCVIFAFSVSHSFIIISRSKDFHDFLSLCVVKSPEMRSSAADLMTVSRFDVNVVLFIFLQIRLVLTTIHDKSPWHAWIRWLENALTSYFGNNQ